MTALQAYHGDQAIKYAILAQLSAHRAADEIIKGQYWENGKGCAVGCTIYSGKHAEYETRFGIPQMLASLEDRIFEGLPNGSAKLWPERFMSAFVPGRYYSRVGWQFLHWILTDASINHGIEHELVRDAVKQCAGVVQHLAKGHQADASATIAAWSAATSAASAAECAALSAAWSARSAALIAESAARSAAWSAASAARIAAWSAASAAECAARIAESAARIAESGAWSAIYSTMADKLVELIEATP